METNARRTLLKSAPELWELADDQARREIWMAGLLGATGQIEVTVTDREAERMLAWQTVSGGSFGRIVLELTEKGFGTSVVITTHHQASPSHAAKAVQNLLDDLGSPERQPFARA